MMSTGIAIYLSIFLIAIQSCSDTPIAASHNDTMDVTPHMDKEAVATRTGSS